MKNTVKKIVGFTVALLALVGVASSASAAACTSYTFGSGVYTVGSPASSYIKEVQQFLNANGAVVSTSGAGSAGYETMNYGPKTKAAVRVFQVAHGVANTGNFGPITRAAALAVQTANCGNTQTPPPQSGPVSASLASNTPASGTLVSGSSTAQATADLAHFMFSGNGVVTNVTLQRIGVSADSTLSNVYLFDGANRLTDASSVSNNGMISFNIPAGIFTVAGMKNISVKSDIAAGTSGQTVGVKLVSFVASGSPASTVNISGNLHSIANATLATVGAGTVTPTAATVDPAAGVTVWQSTLTIANRDVWMKRLALRNLGSAPASSFANFKLFVNGIQVGTAAGVDANGYVTFDLNAAPTLLVSGARVVRVDADIVSGSSRTFQFSLRNAADVDFVDSSFGVNISPTSTPWTSATANTISGSSGGTLTIAKDISSPSINLVNAASDAVIGVFKVTAYGEPIKLENIRATYTSSDANIGSLRNGRILINGVQYGSTATLNEDSQGTPYTQYTLNYTVVPGSPVLLEVRADIYDNDGTDSITAGTDTINATIAAGSTNAQRVDSLGSFSSPSSAVSSNTLTIASTSLTLSKNGTYANQSTTLPASGFKIGSWNLAGSSVESVLLSTLSFDVDESTGTEFDEGDMTNIYVVVKNGNTVVASPTPLSTGSTGADLNFSINYTLPANQSLSIELFADLADDTLDKVAGVSSGTDAIDATDSFVTDLTVTGTSNSGTAITATSADTAGQIIAYAAATLVAVIDPSSPVKGITYDNQTVTSAAFKFTSTTSAFNVSDVTLTIPASGATVVQSVMLYDGATLLGTQPGGTTSVSFSGLTFGVPANQSKVLTVKLQLGPVGVGAGTSQSSLLTTLTAFTSVTGGVSDVSANDSGQSQENNPASAVTSVYAAIPVISKVNLSGDTLGQGSGYLTNGTGVPLMRFKVDATGGPVAWNQVFFDVIKDSATVFASATLWDVTGGGNTQITMGTTTHTTTGAGSTSGTVLLITSAEEVVSTTKTYELRGTITLADAVGDYIGVTIANDNTSSATALAAAATIYGADTDAPIVWSDMSAASHALTTLDWTDDFGVRNLPVSQTVSFPN